VKPMPEATASNILRIASSIQSLGSISANSDRQVTDTRFILEAAVQVKAAMTRLRERRSLIRLLRGPCIGARACFARLRCEYERRITTVGQE
jgi:hypothetical protein